MGDQRLPGRPHHRQLSPVPGVFPSSTSLAPSRDHSPTAEAELRDPLLTQWHSSPNRPPASAPATLLLYSASRVIASDLKLRPNKKLSKSPA